MNLRGVAGFILSAGILFLFWIILSGHPDPVHLGMGVIASLLIAYLAPIYDTTDPDTTGAKRSFLIVCLLSIPYLIRLQSQIIRANIDLIRIIFHPDLPISPTIRRFETDLTSDTAKATFGNSLTLTPGTLTMDMAGDGTCFIHYLTRPDRTQQKTEMLHRAVQNLFERRIV
ncbi:multicomponent Na+:H+ antiporter subunit E [Methanocalculus alkaliphilus]|uniref:Na+/H+ antiporter subunit E n=1 Tax=Methanocalculus alkaliphilus TaxID=768730 RepID=UPI0020A02582|nr:Na+/H+ antiporter subunit E [Methanocalculus alkaliphilus]MCP1714663.1 multicomponent Na+:H+ antiporter subunit E [Methanocalculus alkaliphilus]